MFKIQKNTIAVAALLLTGTLATAQVGINNDTPKATLDITAKNTNGSTPEGLIAPRLTGDQIKAADTQYGTAQKGTIVYATAAVTAASTKTAAITAEGYYYFDGGLWQKVANGSTYSGSSSVVINGSSFERAALSGDVTASQNSNATTIAANAVNSAKIADGTVANADLTTGAGGIYKGSGSLAGNTTVSQGANSLAFTSTSTNGFSVDGNTLSVDAANDRIGIGTATPTAKLEVNNGSTPGAIKIVDGNQSVGRVLVSDDNGIGTWKTLSSGSWTGVWYGFSASYNGNLTGGSTLLYGNGGASNVGVITVPKSGMYKITAALRGSYVTSDGQMNFWLTINGTNVGWISDNNIAPADGQMFISTSQYIHLNAGAALSFPRQDSGGKVNDGSIEVTLMKED